LRIADCGLPRKLKISAPDRFKKPLSILRNKHDLVVVILWNLREL